MVSPQDRRKPVELDCQKGLSQRRARGLIGVAGSSLSYVMQLPANDAVVIEVMKSLSAQ